MLLQKPIASGIKARVSLALLLAALLAVAALSVGAPSVAQAATITVDSTTNTVADDGLCTLREAITAANTDTASGATAGECPAGSGADTIELGVALTYTLDVVDNSTDGDNGLPSITSEITINGNGSTIERIEGFFLEFRIFHVGASGDLSLNDVTITGGSWNTDSADFGGGIVNQGVLIIADNTISFNVSATADGIQNNGTMTITDSTLSGNVATIDSGGAISNVGEATITGSTVIGNRADSKGGGIHNIGTMTITNSTISGNDVDNTVFFGGGGIYNSGTVTITNSTINGNTATLEGGGIHNSGTATITNSTISGNNADFGAGGILNFSGTTNLTNVIIADNPSGDCSWNVESITSLSHNLDSDGSCNLTDPTDLPSTDPLIGPLQDNGGPTETHQLLPGSPAIDAGGLIATVKDQRGVNRSYGTDSDIGAFESQGDCTLILDVSYTAGTATIEAMVGTSVPATKNIWGTAQSNVLNLESTAILVTDPPVTDLVFSGAVPAQGVVAVFATLTTPEDGIICSDFKNLDTGSGP